MPLSDTPSLPYRWMLRLLMLLLLLRVLLQVAGLCRHAIYKI